MKLRISVIFLVLLIFFGLYSNDLDETLESLSGKAAESYVSPVVSALGSNLNGGWYHKAPKKTFLGLDFELGLVAIVTMMNDEDTEFATTGSFRFNRGQAAELAADVPLEIRDYVIDAIIEQDFEVLISGPTVAGSNDESVMIEFPGATIDYEENGISGSEEIGSRSIDTGVTGLMDEAGALPMFAPQLSIGTLYGTRFTLRGLPPFEVEDLGEVSYIGGGLQHNIKSWVPVPLDVSLSLFMQSLSLGEYVKATGVTGGLNVSKTFGTKMLSVTPYAGYMLEKYNMEFSYDYMLSEVSDEEIKINFDVDGENTHRFTAGLSFKLGFSHLNFDYNVGKYQSVTAGLAVAF